MLVVSDLGSMNQCERKHCVNVRFTTDIDTYVYAHTSAMASSCFNIIFNKIDASPIIERVSSPYVLAEMIICSPKK